jgi:hypothetical protein
MRGINRTCRERDCFEAPYLGGLCRMHHEEELLRKKRRDAAIQALHSGEVDDRLPDDQALREELLRLGDWWNRACSAVRTKHNGEFMPLDEAEYAMEWCISLAEEIIEAEMSLRAGKPISDKLAATQFCVWERLRNLEAGLRSNGLPRLNEHT